MLISTLFLFLYACYAVFVLSNDLISDNIDIYPKQIRKRDQIRKDIYTNQPVQTGRLDLLGGLSNYIRNRNGQWNNTNQVTYQEFKRILQCPINEPGLNHHGTLKLIKELHPINKDIIDVTCAMIENENICINQWGQVNWKACKELANRLHTGILCKYCVYNILNLLIAYTDLLVKYGCIYQCIIYDIIYI